jgi:lipopolysaccharide transport system ATP-binding protein
MEDVPKEGRTVIFVSHNMAAIKRLCNKSISLTNGKINLLGKTDEVVTNYLAENKGSNDFKNDIKKIPRNPIILLKDVRVIQERSNTINLKNGLPFFIEIDFTVLEEKSNLRLYIDVIDTQGVVLFRTFNDELCERKIKIKKGFHTYKIEMPEKLFSPGEYQFLIKATFHNEFSVWGNGLSVFVKFDQSYPYSLTYPDAPIIGSILPAIKWERK